MTDDISPAAPAPRPFLHRPLARIAWRTARRHPWQSLLMVAGIALGVAVIVAIDLANESAARAFALSTRAVVGRATHEISGGPAGVDAEVYRRLRRAGVREIAPLISAYATAPALGDRTLELLGVDPFAEAPFRPYLDPARAGTGDELTAFLALPNAVALGADTARGHGVKSGDVLEIEIGGRPRAVTVGALLESDDPLTRRALAGLLLCDIATAQELTGRRTLDRIDLVLPADDSAVVQRVESMLGAGTRLRPVGVRTGTAREMTAAFQTNLRALSLLALVVGMFLIFNTMTFAVVQRRALYGTLRCIGATRAEVFTAVCAEAAVIGLVATTAGILLGIALGQGAVAMVTQTINDLYFVVTVRGMQVAPASIVKGIAVGLVATVAAAAWPAREAAYVSPAAALSRSLLEHKTRRGVRRAALGGLLLGLAGALLLAVPTRSLLVAFAALFLIVMGFALVAPLATAAMMYAVTPLAARVWGVLGRAAPRAVVAALSRTSVAVAALMVAVAVTVGLGVMIRSFRATVQTWLDQTLHGDVYISARSAGTANTEPLDPAVLDALARVSLVRRIDIARSTRVDSARGPLAVTAFSRPPVDRTGLFLSADGDAEHLAAALRAGGALVTEPLANRLALPRRGARLTLFTNSGPRTVPVVGVYRDYASSQGFVALDLSVYRRWWNDDSVSAAALILSASDAAEPLAVELRQRLAPLQQLDVRPNRALRAEVFAVFDRAFAITNALLFLAATVAGLGVLGALLAMQLERQHELGILRAIGVTSRQLAGRILLETGLMGGAAGLLAMPTGALLAAILVYIINRRAFGWTLQLQLEWVPFAQAFALAVVAALLAGLPPAWRMERTPPAEALRYE
jgi:putative ABC transport system permease protein